MFFVLKLIPKRYQKIVKIVMRHKAYGSASCMSGNEKRDKWNYAIKIL